MDDLESKTEDKEPLINFSNLAESFFCFIHFRPYDGNKHSANFRFGQQYQVGEVFFVGRFLSAFARTTVKNAIASIDNDMCLYHI